METTTTIHRAAELGDTESLRQLLQSDPTLVDSRGEHDKTPLHWAAEKNHVEAARVLLDAGANYDVRTSWGATPLEWAAMLGNRKVAELIMERGDTRLDLRGAAGIGRLDLVDGFLDLGMDACRAASRLPTEQERKDTQGWPPSTAYLRGDIISDAFHFACRNGHVEVAKTLLDEGADLNATGYFGATGLHWAAINGHLAAVQFLVESGAKTEIKDPVYNGTPRDWAKEGGHTEIMRYLDLTLP